MNFDDESIQKHLGASSGLVMPPDVVRYVAGCMKRERERLAKIIESTEDSKALADAIVDDSDDMKVFKWGGP